MTYSTLCRGRSFTPLPKRCCAAIAVTPRFLIVTRLFRDAFVDSEVADKGQRVDEEVSESRVTARFLDERAERLTCLLSPWCLPVSWSFPSGDVAE